MCFKEADIMLPRRYGDAGFMQKWAVIACDQYTSDISYWEYVEKFVGDNMSALGLIFPEIYLERESDAQRRARIKNITESMREYSGDFVCFESAMFLVERRLKSGAVRHGLVGAVDLEQYSYDKGARARVRSTEETVLSRIPPRVEVREGAELELPHAMLLYDDEQDLLIGGLRAGLGRLQKIYDFELMRSSGCVRAYLLDAPHINFVKNTLGGFDNQDFLFAVGDGNHSLAAAKACYENIKKSGQDYLNHPARHALCEIVNIHDKSLEFEPIHRILFDIDLPHLCGQFHSALRPEERRQVQPLQLFLDKYLENHGGRIDYIHGERELINLALRDGAMGFICETVPKSGFFEAIRKGGTFPRKTFSMGEADDKRFYVECRRIK